MSTFFSHLQHNLGQEFVILEKKKKKKKQFEKIAPWLPYSHLKIDLFWGFHSCVWVSTSLYFMLLNLAVEMFL